MASAPTLDNVAAAMRAAHTCYACGRVYNAATVQRDPGWEPTRSGWRCGACSRARARQVRARARELVGQTEPRWELVTRSPKHTPFDDCAECEAVLAAREMLLARGVLTRAERGELAAVVLTSL